MAASTLAELARKHRIDLGPKRNELYRFVDLASFLRVYGLVCEAVREPDDFERMDV